MALIIVKPIEPEVLGFCANYAVFPYTKAAETGYMALLVQKCLESASLPPRESEVVLPSAGVMMVRPSVVRVAMGLPEASV